MINRKRKYEEQCESSQKKILRLTVSQDVLLLANGILSNEITLKIKNIDAIQTTTEQLISDKQELKTKLQQTAEE